MKKFFLILNFAFLILNSSAQTNVSVFINATRSCSRRWGAYEVIEQGNKREGSDIPKNR